MPRKNLLQMRKGTSAEWAAKSPSPVLELGEPGVETDTHMMKIGDGVTSWSTLPYVTCPIDEENVPVQVSRDTETNWAASTTPLLNGQIGFNQTNGAVKIGDGVSLWPTLPDIRKQFPNVVTVAKTGKPGTADFICSDAFYGGSDAACIQAAIDYAKAHDIHVMIIFEGTYSMSNYVSIDFDIVICGIGNPIFEWGTEYIDLIQCSGSIYATYVGTTNITAGDKTVIMPDVSHVNQGDLLFIYDDTIWNNTESGYDRWKTGEIHEVVSVDTNTGTVTFHENALHDYTIENNLSIELIKPISVDISGLTINGSTSSGQIYLVGLSYCKNSSVHNCVIDKGSKHGIYLFNCFNVSVYNNEITNCENNGNGYGISVANASAHMLIHDNYIMKCRHCFTAGGLFTIGQPRDLRIYNNELYSTFGEAIDAHQCVESIIAYNNTIHGDGVGESGAIASGAKITKFYNNYVTDCDGAGVRGAIKDLIYSVENNEFHRCGRIFSDGATGTNSEKYVNVSNNHIYDTTVNAIEVRKASYVTICNNYIDGTINYYGIYLINIPRGLIANNMIHNMSRSAMSLIDVSNLHIVGNDLVDCCQGGEVGKLYDACISIQGTSNNVTIENNIISDSTAKMRNGIREYDTANNNTIIHNIISAAIVYRIATIGNGTIITDNIGYKTENTGTATITATTTSITVSHGLAATPTRVIVTPTSSTEGISYYVPEALKTATTFTITMLSAPTTNVSFDWSAVV